MFVIEMSNLVEFLVVRLLFRREEEEMTSLDRRLDVCCKTVVILVLFVTVAETGLVLQL